MFYEKRTFPSAVESLLSGLSFAKAAPDRNPSPIGNIISTYFISGLDLVLLITVTVFIPALASKEDFGNYRLMVLYAGYAGFLHFGVLNGLYLELLGKSIGPNQIRLASAVRRLLLLLQFVTIPLGCLLLLVAVTGPGKKIIVLVVAIAWACNNLTTFHNYFWQATNNFTNYTKVNGASRIIGLIVAGAIIIAGKVSTVWLALLLVLPILTSTSLYEVTWRGVVGKPEEAAQGMGSVWKRGVVLFGANIATFLLFSSDKLCIGIHVDQRLYDTDRVPRHRARAIFGRSQRPDSARLDHYRFAVCAYRVVRNCLLGFFRSGQETISRLCRLKSDSLAFSVRSPIFGFPSTLCQCSGRGIWKGDAASGISCVRGCGDADQHGSHTCVHDLAKNDGYRLEQRHCPFGGNRLDLYRPLRSEQRRGDSAVQDSGALNAVFYRL